MELEKITYKICNDIIDIMNDKNEKSFLEIFNELLNSKYILYINSKIDILSLIPSCLSKLGYEIDNKSNRLIKY